MSSDDDVSAAELALELRRDPEYLAWVEAVWTPWFGKRYGERLDPERAYMQWREQAGVCAATGLLMTPPGPRGEARDAYTATLVVCDKRRPVGAAGNTVFVVRFVAQMYDPLASVGVSTLAQFYALAGFVRGG